jgi:CO/xanthine dehydrogenase Mo-binding subunit
VSAGAPAVDRPTGVGAAVTRVEDAALLTGRGRFLDDFEPIPGALHAAIVRSPHAHARIRDFDARRALQTPGVHAVVGPDDIAGLRPFALSVKAPMPYRPGATDRVRYVGEPVAVVVANSRHVAEDAAERVEVDYEPTPAVVGVLDAMAPDAPRRTGPSPSGPWTSASPTPHASSPAASASRATPRRRSRPTRSSPTGSTTTRARSSPRTRTSTARSCCSR